MSIDLETTDGRKKYLSDKLDDLLDGINESYGKILMEELLNRLELTISDFNDEMKTLCNQLVKKQEERQHLLEMLRASEEMPVHKKSGTTVPTDEKLLSEEIDDDIPVWEKKLAKLEKK